MVLVAEILVLLALFGVGMRWFLRSPIHRARKNSGAFPPQVAGHMGFGMYSSSNPPTLPHGLHDHRQETGEQEGPGIEAPDPDEA